MCVIFPVAIVVTVGLRERLCPVKPDMRVCDDDTQHLAAN